MTVTHVLTEASGMRELTALDRCDRCGAQAYVLTTHGATEMLWCAHHFVEHEPKLAALVTIDNREAVPQ